MIRLHYRCFDLLMTAFVTVLIISNIASSAKIVDLGFSLFGIRLAFDGGTLLFPFSYILGDILTEVYGFKASRRAIWSGFIGMALVSGVFLLLRLLPSDPSWESYAGSGAYDAILGGINSGGLVIASLAAYFVGEFSNSAILSRMKLAMQGKHLWVRTIGSTLVGELLDSFVFIAIATAAGVFSQDMFVSLVFTNYLFKCSLEALMTPLTALTIVQLKKVEAIDTYDKGVSLNPFKAS
ncbi:MAG: queuosine precursor transporter [Spirochaetaceae bacterium]|nr:queuosine precursor transporter [Spirochaetaceae bacterium]